MMIDKRTAYKMLDAALETGADFAEIFVERNVKNSITVTNGLTDRALSGVDYGLGLRIICGDKVIYVYTNDTTTDALMHMAKQAAQAVNGKQRCVIRSFDKQDYYGGIGKALIMPDSVKKSQIVDMLKSADNAARSYSDAISQTRMSYTDSVQDVCIINSEGLWATDKRVRTRAAVSAVASNESEKQTGYFGPGAMKGYEFYDSINLDELAVEAARSAYTMLNAGQCPSGKMDVIMDNGFGGVIFHEACGHGLEITAVSKNASVFAGKLGEKIASDKVTAIDDGRIKGQWGSINIDDEGVPARKKILIENGILKGYMSDRFNGARVNYDVTGSSRRQSYRYMPVARMTNTYIASGTDKTEDIIANTEYGLYAKYMGGGSVNPASGEFNFAVNEAYIVRNGKICEPVRGATLIGKGSEVLMNIDMVGDNLALAEGMCGAASGSIPVCVGQPRLRVKNMTVGGRG
jgi:TldD protein